MDKIIPNQKGLLENERGFLHFSGSCTWATEADNNIPGLGKPYEMKRVSQIDLTPTLALSFGLSIPKNRYVSPHVLTYVLTTKPIGVDRHYAVQGTILERLSTLRSSLNYEVFF